ncbi:hypothetical protein L9F63_017622, partial [Diploptera punctata]
MVKKCESIFKSCTYKETPFNCCDRLVQFSTEVGFCYAFNSRLAHTLLPDNGTITDDFKDEKINEGDISWSLKVQASKDKEEIPNIKIYVHSAEETPTVELSPLYTWRYDMGKILFTDKQTYTTSDSRQLSIKQRKCAFPDEIKLDTDVYYTFSGCMSQCRLRLAKEKCNCVPPFYRKI